MFLYLRNRISYCVNQQRICINYLTNFNEVGMAAKKQAKVKKGNSYLYSGGIYKEEPSYL